MEVKLLGDMKFSSKLFNRKEKKRKEKSFKICMVIEGGEVGKNKPPIRMFVRKLYSLPNFFV